MIVVRPTPEQIKYADMCKAYNFQFRQDRWRGEHNPERRWVGGLCEAAFRDLYGFPYLNVEDSYAGHDIVLGNFKIDVKGGFVNFPVRPSYWSGVRDSQIKNDTDLFVFAMYNRNNGGFGPIITFTGWAPKIRMTSVGYFLAEKETEPRGTRTFTSPVDQWCLYVKYQEEIESLDEFCVSHKPVDIPEWEKKATSHIPLELRGKGQNADRK